MKMNKMTIQKIENLHNGCAARELDHYKYDRLRHILGEKNVPAWQTLKNHGLVVFERTEIRYECGYEDEFVAINVYKVNF